MANKPRILLTNDDGPPGPHSPYIFGLYRHLVNELGWDVKVVIPSTQKSWIGKAYQIQDLIKGCYYYPTGPDGNGEKCPASRPLLPGEVGEWILLDGTPATCTNIAVHNLYKGEIDLVISGPNYGRNTSAAFSLSSGTIGGALSSALSQIRSIALSYGTMKRAAEPAWFDPAHALAMRIIQHLYKSWGSDPFGLRKSPGGDGNEVDLYSINVPMVEELLQEGSLPVVSTQIWRNTYGRLFKAHEEDDAPQVATQSGSPAGPDSATSHTKQWDPPTTVDPAQQDIGGLVFKWAPSMGHLINPPISSIPVGSDAWALNHGYVSVTALRASFAEPELEEFTTEPRFWKVKL